MALTTRNPTATPSLRIGVIGLDHLHAFEMVGGLVDAGATTVCHTGGNEFSELYAGWRHDSEERSVDAILADSTLDLIVSAAVPSTRADITIEALTTGRHVLAAKPAVTSIDQLHCIDAVVRETDRRWWVFYSERWCNRAVAKAVELVESGAIGDLVAITGAAPHRLSASERPDWFRDPEQGGSILVDLAAHQADQLLALAGPGAVEVLAASIVASPSSPWPGFCDLGRMSLRHVNAEGHTVLSDHHVDWLTPNGLGTWGDARLFITGTVGSIEVRANIDVTGSEGGEHLILVDPFGTHRVDCSTKVLDWADRLIHDITTGADTLCAHQHTVAATHITLAAESTAFGAGPSTGGTKAGHR